MSKHTPGPWKLRHVSGSNANVQEFEIRGMFGHKAAVYPIFNRSNFGIDGSTIHAHPADATLIAAAPELLEALKAIVLDVQGYEAWQRPCHALDLAKAAIAKATGAQP